MVIEEVKLIGLPLDFDDYSMTHLAYLMSHPKIVTISLHESSLIYHKAIQVP